MDKIFCLTVSSYYERTVKIPVSRLRTMVKKGDIIRSLEGVKLGASYVGYKVTHVDWWGVYAVPAVDMLAGMACDFNAGYVRKCMRHFKFKWQNITGIIFNEV